MSQRMTAVLAWVHEVIRADDDDLDKGLALAACLQLSLAGPHLARLTVRAAADDPLRLRHESPRRDHRRRPRPVIHNATFERTVLGRYCLPLVSISRNEV